MTDKEKLALARMNGIEKQYTDQSIGKAVLESISLAEENAQDRKAIIAILKALEKANIEVDASAIAEFNEYNAKVEAIKNNTKSKHGGK